MVFCVCEGKERARILFEVLDRKIVEIEMKRSNRALKRMEIFLHICINR